MVCLSQTVISFAGPHAAQNYGMFSLYFDQSLIHMVENCGCSPFAALSSQLVVDVSGRHPTQPIQANNSSPAAAAGEAGNPTSLCAWVEANSHPSPTCPEQRAAGGTLRTSHTFQTEAHHRPHGRKPFVVVGAGWAWVPALSKVRCSSDDKVQSMDCIMRSH